MSKAIVIGIVSVGGAGAVGVGGYALFGNGFGLGGSSDSPATTPVSPVEDRSNSQLSTNTSPQPRISTIQSTGGDTNYEDKLETLDSPNEAVKDGECFKWLFGENLSFDSNDTSSTIDGTNIDFGDPINPPNPPSDDDSQTYTGCVRIQGKKVTFSVSGSNKYTGVFSGVGAFKGTKSGMAIFGVAKTNTQNKNLDVEGVVYLLGKQTTDGDSDTWQVNQKKTSGKKTLTSGEAGNKLPKASNNISSGDTYQEDGQWLSGSQLNNIDDGSATGGNQESESHTPRWSYNQYLSTTPNITIYNGCKDLNGLEHLFDNTSSQLTSKLNNWTGTG